MIYRNFKLDKFQVEAIRYLNEGFSVIVCAPTGSGKTLIAEYLIESEISKGNKIIYTAPIKAINNQKYRDFSKIYPEKVGLLTGDVTINANAQCLIMTTEILRNMILDKDERLKNVSYIIFDEVHYMDDYERGSVWEESFIYAPTKIKFLCLSATISNIKALSNWLSTIRGEEFKYILNLTRPVPLSFYSFSNGKLLPLNKNYKIEYMLKNKEKFQIGSLIRLLKETNKLPAIIFLFSRDKTQYYASELSSIDFLSFHEKEQLKKRYYEIVKALNIDEYFLYNLKPLLLKGICYHHAGLLPSIKELIEQLFSSGLIKVLFATETFALGVNFPAKSVIFPSLSKKQNGKILPIKKRDFLQMAGRAGRRGIDKCGYIYIIADSPLKLQSINTYLNVDVGIEPISSKFNLNYATILNLYKDLKEDVVDAFEKSFAYYSLTKQTHNNISVKIKRNLQNKLKLLKDMNYIYDFQLTSKGNFASKLYGYELFLTEIFFDNLVEKVTAEELCIVFSALLYDSNVRNIKSYGLIKSSSKTLKLIENKAISISKLEKQYNITSLFTGLNFGMAKYVEMWYKGKTLEEIHLISDIYLGDLVRHLRHILQLCRELYEIVKGYPSFADKLTDIIIKLNRDEVDAYKQLSAF